MERARVALFEDDEDVRLLSQLVVGDTSHEIVAEASSRQEALEVVDKVEAGELEVDVFLVDGQLSTQSESGEDALAIHDYIVEKKIGGVILGFSAEPMGAEHCDIDVPGKSIFKAVGIIDTLPAPTQADPAHL